LNSCSPSLMSPGICGLASSFSSNDNTGEPSWRPNYSALTYATLRPKFLTCIPIWIA
jgi:hypothetical protein